MRLLALAAIALGLCACSGQDNGEPNPDPKATAKTPSAKTPPAKTAKKSPTSQPTTPPAKLDVQHVDAKAADALRREDAAVVVLDVRTPAEYAAGHLQAAVNIDFRADDFATKLGELDRDKKYLVHCRSGGRSTSALATFEKLGFQHIWHLDGGMLGWEEAKLPVEK